MSFIFLRIFTRSNTTPLAWDLDKKILKTISEKPSGCHWKVVNITHTNPKDDWKGVNLNNSHNNDEYHHSHFISYNHPFCNNLGCFEIRVHLSCIEFWLLQPKYGVKSSDKHLAFLFTELLWFLSEFHQFAILDPTLYNSEFKPEIPSLSKYHKPFPEMCLGFRWYPDKECLADKIMGDMGTLGPNKQSGKWGLKHTYDSPYSDFRHILSYDILGFKDIAFFQLKISYDRFYIYLAPNPLNPNSNWRTLTMMYILLQWHMRSKYRNDFHFSQIDDLLIPSHNRAGDPLLHRPF